MIECLHISTPPPTPRRSENVRDSTENHQIPNLQIRNICCIGAGYVGGPTCSVIAYKNPEVVVNVVDLSPGRIQAWNSDNLPIAEPNLLEVVQKSRDGSDKLTPNLHFSTNVDQAIEDADLIFVAVNTPTKTSGYGANQALDMGYFESAIQRIAEISQTSKIVVEKSTVPCGTAKYAQEILAGFQRPGVHFEILSNPEFLAEGTAVKNLLNPDRVLIGSENTESGRKAKAALADIYASWVPRDRIIEMSISSAELAKLAANALLAQRISSINALSSICEATGADVDEVAFAIGLDTRIGPHMLKASVGFGGSCFKKDVLNLAHFSDTLLLPNIATYWRAVNDINEYQKDHFAQRIITRLHNTLTDKRVAILGLAFKKDTGDIRESAALSVVSKLIAEKADLAIYDPEVEEDNFWHALDKEFGLKKDDVGSKVTLYATGYEACQGAHAVVILTEWDEFSNRTERNVGRVIGKQHVHVQVPELEKTNANVVAKETYVDESEWEEMKVENGFNGLSVFNGVQKSGDKMNWKYVASIMKHPKVIFDGRNVVDMGKLTDLGFQVECIGKPGTKPSFK